MIGNHSILYLGPGSGTSRQRADALRRLGHSVWILDPRQFLPANSVIDKWIFETGGFFFEDRIRRCVLSEVVQKDFDLVYVDGGALVGPLLVRELKRRFGTVINYNIDDPYGSRDSSKWRLYLAALSEYDLVIVVRPCNKEESQRAGARRTFLIGMSCDEVAHAPRHISEQIRQKWAADVLFVGTWMPERGPLLVRLIELGVPLTIYGDRWQKAPEWTLLEKHWRGPGIHHSDDYAFAVQCSKVCLGLLSKGNRDMVTTRSVEIPRLGGVLCAERTSEHLRLYKEDEEAVFWTDAQECADRCRQLLSNEPWRARVARNGQIRCLANGLMNEQILSKILSTVHELNLTEVVPALE